MRDRLVRDGQFDLNPSVLLFGVVKFCLLSMKMNHLFPGRNLFDLDTVFNLLK